MTILRTGLESIDRLDDRRSDVSGDSTCDPRSGRRRRDGSRAMVEDTDATDERR
jgi:hypothetical protein